MTPIAHKALAGLCLPFLAAAPAAQSFRPGDVYVHVLQADFTAHVLRLDRAAGSFSSFVDASGAAIGTAGQLAWDPSRGCLLLAESGQILAVGADGTKVTLTGGPVGRQLYGLSPARNGRIFCWSMENGIEFAEPDGALHPLLDATTGQPFVHQPALGQTTDVLTYHPVEHALYTATKRGTASACGAASTVVIQKLPLDASGTAVQGTLTCSSFTLTGGSPNPVAWTQPSPGGLALVTTGPFTFSTIGRVFAVDPDSLAISTLASPSGFLPPFAIGAGTWSWAEKRVLVLDYANDMLRGYSPGGSGLGASIRSLGVDVAGGTFSMVEIPPRRLVFDKGKLGQAVGLVPAAGLQPAVAGGQAPPVAGQPSWLALSDEAGSAVAILGPAPLAELLERASLALGALEVEGLGARIVTLGPDGVRVGDALALRLE